MDSFLETNNALVEGDDSFFLQLFDKEEDKVLVEPLDVSSKIMLEEFSIAEQEDDFEYMFPDSVDLQYEECNDFASPSSSTSETFQIEVNGNNVEEFFDPTKVTETPKRRRGRRPKSEASLYPSLPKERRPKKNKLYEIAMPFEDEASERKRQNAILAKLHREQTKLQMQCLQKEVEKTNKEKEELFRESERLKKNIAKLKESLKTYKERTFSIVSELKQ